MPKVLVLSLINLGSVQIAYHAPRREGSTKICTPDNGGGGDCTNGENGFVMGVLPT